MAKLQLSFACGLYDRMQPLYTGEVKVEGIDLNFIAIDQPRPIFDRMAGGEEFDVAEFSSSEFVQRFARKQCPFVAIPVFPSRAFRHGFIAVHRQAGIKTPKGRALKTKLVPLAEEVNEVALRHVDPGDIAATRRTLLALIANLAADEAQSLALRRRIPSTRELSRLLNGSRPRARKSSLRRRGRTKKRTLWARRGTVSA